MNVSTKLEIKLPQCKAVLGGNISPIAPILMVLGGRRPESAWLGNVAKTYPEVWAADSGGSVCLTAAITPVRLVGDFDSISSSDKSDIAAQGATINEHPVDKDKTDYQLCLELAGKEGKKNVIVSGAWGGRFDHTQSNVYSAMWAREWGVRVLCLADEREVFFYLHGNDSIEIFFDKKPGVVSLIALDTCEHVSVYGTQWDINAERLLPKHPYTISNKPINDRVKVHLRKGALGVYVSGDAVQI